MLIFSFKLSLQCRDQTPPSVTDSQTHNRVLGLSITLQSTHAKSAVLREASQFHIMYCYYFNIKGKERGELGSQTCCLAGIVLCFFHFLAVVLSSPSVPRDKVRSISQPITHPRIADRPAGFAISSLLGQINPFPSWASGFIAHGHQVRGRSGADTLFTAREV